ncbi:hypothetical protein BGZ60DRAFT_237141 [Tricladium varicosporioides]|nr:hypothetical protein BGZ60DRAFT_237141 [Hymenoscyphus varicosporioides]
MVKSRSQCTISHSIRGVIVSVEPKSLGLERAMASIEFVCPTCQHRKLIAAFGFCHLASIIGVKFHEVVDDSDLSALGVILPLADRSLFVEALLKSERCVRKNACVHNITRGTQPISNNNFERPTSTTASKGGDISEPELLPRPTIFKFLGLKCSFASTYLWNLKAPLIIKT